MTLQAGGITWTWQSEKSKSTRSFHKEHLEQLREALTKNRTAGVTSQTNSANRQSLQITDVHKTKKKTFSPGLYDLTELQRDANRRFGFSAKETLNIMQRLYENHKVLTYPRTDSRYISSDVVPTIKERLKAINFGPYKAYVPTSFKSSDPHKQIFCR